MNESIDFSFPGPKIMTTFRVDANTYESILVLAKREDRTVSDIIRQALDYYIEVAS